MMMHGCSRLGAAVFFVLILGGCEIQGRGPGHVLFGEKSTVSVGSEAKVNSNEDALGGGDTPREAEAFRAVQQHIGAAPPALGGPAPQPGLVPGPAGAATSMGEARLIHLERQLPDPQTGAGAPVMEWISATAAQGQLEPGLAQPVMANAPTAGPVPSRLLDHAEVQSLERSVRLDPNDLETQLRLRYLYLAEGQAGKAVDLPQGMDAQRAERLVTLMRAVSDAGLLIEAPLLDPGVTERFESLAAMIRERTELRITGLDLCSSIQSYGRYDAVPEGFFVAGSVNRAYVYCELRNFASEWAEGGFKARVAHRLELLTSTGETLWSDPEMLEVVDVCRSRRTDFFFNRLWTLPSSIPAGDYVLNVIVEDRLKGQRTEVKRPLRVAWPGLSSR